MTRDDYYTALVHLGLQFEPQAGALACCTDAAAGSASVLCDLRPVARLAMRGRDARKFLQGYLTCDLNALAPERWLVGALCNLQGRMIGSFIATDTNSGSGTDESITLHMHAATLPIVQQTLAKYAVFAKAKLKDETDDWIGMGLIGPAAQTALRSIGIEPAPTSGVRQDVQVALGSDPHIGAEILVRGQQRWELWLPTPAADPVWRALSAQLPVADQLRWQGADVADGMAWVDGSSSGEYLPQAFNLDLVDAVSFTKGCYLGQEIVTRLQHRGETKRRLYRLAVGAPAQLGDSVYRVDGRTVGRLVQLGRNAAGALEALAVLDRSEAAGPLHLSTGPIAQLKLPYPFPA